MIKPNLHLSTALLIGLIILVYCISPVKLPVHDNANELSRLYLLKSLIDNHTPLIDFMVERYGFVGDIAKFEDHYYSDKVPGHALVTAPAYLLIRAAYRQISGQRINAMPLVWQKYWMTVLGNIIPFLIFLFYFQKVLFKYSKSEGITSLLLISYAFGTIAFPYTVRYTGHIWGMMLLFGAVYLVALGRPTKWAKLAAGTLAGLSISTELLTVPMVAVLAVWLLAGEHRRKVLYFLAGCLAGILPLLLYNYWCFGSPFTLAYHYVDASRFVEEAGQTSVTQLGWPGPLRILSLLFSPQRGLFFFSPFLLFSIPGYLVIMRNSETRRESWLYAGLIGANLIFVSSLSIWKGGWAFGARYLLPALPYYFMGVAGWLGHTGQRRRQVSIYIAFFLAVVPHFVVGVATYPLFPPEVSANPLPDLPWMLVNEGVISLIVAQETPLSSGQTFTLLAVIVAVTILLALWHLFREFNYRSPSRKHTLSIFLTTLCLAILLTYSMRRLESLPDTRTLLYRAEFEAFLGLKEVAGQHLSMLPETGLQLSAQQHKARIIRMLEE